MNIKVFVTGMDEREGVAPLIRAVRMATARLGGGVASMEMAKDVLEGGQAGRWPQLIGETEIESAARHAIRILADGGWTVDSDPQLGPEPEEEFQEPIAQEGPTIQPEPNAGEQLPDHVHDLVAHVVIAMADGNAGVSIVCANNIRAILRREDEEEHAEFWDMVLQSLFDAFPPNIGAGVSMQQLGAEFGR